MPHSLCYVILPTPDFSPGDIAAFHGRGHALPIANVVESLLVQLASDFPKRSFN